MSTTTKTVQQQTQPKYDTEEFPLSCVCGTRAKDMWPYGRTIASGQIFARCRCGYMYIIDDECGEANAENTWLREVEEGELTDEESGYGLF